MIRVAISQSEKPSVCAAGLGQGVESYHMGLGGLQELVMDREAWRAAVRGVMRNWTLLNN